MEIDWSYRGRYIGRHGVTVHQADEAFHDPDRLWLRPDPASQSGVTERVIGWSVSARRVLAVIVLKEGERIIGVNAWPANRRDQRIYREANADVRDS